ncbi:MAG: hypothetical protein COW50_04055, partial [Candidatus Moranbacteria bacterium CG17_big_fil_post_rev_8_21_14_2_50_41_107]
MQTNNSFQNKSNASGLGKPSAPGAFEGIVAHAQAPKGGHKEYVPRQQASGRSGVSPMKTVGTTSVKFVSSGTPSKSKQVGQPRRTAGKKGGQKNNRRFPMPMKSRLESTHNGISVPALGEKRLR